MIRGKAVVWWLLGACAGLLLVACSDDAKKNVGDPCEHNTDCADEICHVGICASKTPLKVGEACSANAECRSFLCKDSSCAAGTRSLGDPCRFNVECLSNACRIEGSLPGLCVEGSSGADGGARDGGPDGGPPADGATPPDGTTPADTTPTGDTGPCGEKDQRCCGGLCNGTLACVDDTCVCGGKDQPCCATDVCDANLTCLTETTNTCACGALQQPCCEGKTCGGGLFCTGTACACIKAIDGSFFIRSDDAVFESAYSNPKAIGLVGGGKQVSHDGGYHACALKPDGTVWCWSKHTIYGNSFGQLGDGTLVTPGTSDVPSQVKVAASTFLTDVTSISAGSYNEMYATRTTCAIKPDTSVWCWGGSQSGVMFQEPAGGEDKPFATQIKASATSMLTGATQVSVNVEHACAVVGGGSLACWGKNTAGQLGSGDTSASQYPVLVTIPAKTVKKVSAGANFTCALTTTGEVYCWGTNGSGECGQGYAGAAIPTPAPVKQKGGGDLTGVEDIGAGSYMACALKTDGTVWCWGKWPSSNHSATQMLDQSSAPITDAALLTVERRTYHVLRSDGTLYRGGQGELGFTCP